MQYFVRIDVSEGIAVNKTSAWNEMIVISFNQMPAIDVMSY